MKYLKTIYLLLCCMLALAACSDDDENSASGALSITTPAYTNVGYALDELHQRNNQGNYNDEYNV